MGVFINITLDDNIITPDEARMLVSLCPVEIFAMEGDRLVVGPEQVDECTLCELCLNAAPIGAITISKTYKDEKLVSRGANPLERQDHGNG
jgi:Fe-S-cluster-containing hydrogenase component 2